MGLEENKNGIIDAMDIMLPLYLSVIHEMCRYKKDLWQNMSDEDAKQTSDKDKIIARYNNFDEIDVQAAQKLFVYRPAFLNCFMDTFRISEINSRFKSCMHSAINCRNDISHRLVDNSKFTDEYMDTNLRDLKEIARYLSSVCPAAKEYYKKFCDRFKDALPEYTSENTFSISSIRENLFPKLSEKDIKLACVECDLHIVDNAVRAVRLEDIQTALSEYFRQLENKHPYLKTQLKPCVDNFIGREDLFAQINDKLKSEHIAVIYGMGGMGKSAAALKYAHDHKNDYSNIQYIFFEKSLRTTIRKLAFDGISCESEMDDERKYENRMEILRKYGKGSLLIIDNMDIDEDNHYMDLMQISCDVIITTRCRINGSDRHIIPIMPLTESEQITLFKLHYFGSDGGTLSADEQTQLNELLKLINGHTLLIELSAKVIRNGALYFHNISEYLTEDKNVSDEVRVIKDNVPTQSSLDGYIDRLFDATQCTEGERYVLSLMTLVPLDGIPLQIFRDLAKLDNNNDINNLRNSSWVHSTGFGINTRLFLHPMISKAVRNRIPATYQSAKDFIFNVKIMLRNGSDDYKKLLCSIAANIVMFVLRPDKEQMECGIEFAGLVFDNMEYKSAKRMLEKLAENDTTVKDQGVEVKLHELMGDVYVRLANYTEAINAYQTASKCHDGTYTGCSRWKLYNKRAFVFRKQSQYDKAEYFYGHAKEDLEKEVKTDPSLLYDLATTYNDMGLLYLNQKEYDKALDFYQKGLDIRKKLDGDFYKELAYSYHNIGTAYQKKGEYEKAKEYHQKGLDIRLKLAKMPDNHPDVMASMTQLGNDYIGCNDLDTAWVYLNNALKIRLMHFGEDHPDVAWSYYSIANWYKENGNVEKAKEYLQKCIDIRVKVLGEKHKYTLNAKQELEKLQHDVV